MYQKQLTQPLRPKLVMQEVGALIASLSQPDQLAQAKAQLDEPTPNGFGGLPAAILVRKVGNCL